MDIIIIALCIISTWALTSLRYKSRMIAAQNRDMSCVRARADYLDSINRGHERDSAYMNGYDAGKLLRKPQGTPPMPDTYGEVQREREMLRWGQ